jgi:predicted SprT family Zn-dependent metalloprotease
LGASASEASNIINSIRNRTKSIRNRMMWIEERHEFWWRKLVGMHEGSKGFLILPEIRYYARKSRTAAFAKKFSCTYNINFAFSVGEKEYDETICHEVCHSFLMQTGKDDGHGFNWRLLMLRCGFSGDRCHKYDLEKVYNSRSKS